MTSFRMVKRDGLPHVVEKRWPVAAHMLTYKLNQRKQEASLLFPGGYFSPSQNQAQWVGTPHKTCVTQAKHNVKNTLHNHSSLI